MVEDNIVPNESNDPPSGENRLKLNELMDLCTTLQAKVLELEKKKASQQFISSDDEEPDLEVQEDEFKQGRSIADIDEDAELDLAGEEVVVEVVIAEEVVVEKVAEKVAEVSLDDDEITLAQTLNNLKSTPKTKGVAPKARNEEEARRLQAIFDEEARMAKDEADKEAKLVEDWDNVKAKMDTDYELASKLQA
ncbi:hypothetical protein Tco_0438742 [Tanacetum coccineum]